jgi:phospholipid transport system transporter-binding protein
MDASTVGELLARSEEFFVDEAQLSVDFSGVTEGDSAGLALLIEWLRAARQRGRPIHFQNIPAQINALARISEVGDLLAKTEAEPAGTAAQ